MKFIYLLTGIFYGFVFGSAFSMVGETSTPSVYREIDVLKVMVILILPFVLGSMIKDD
jgi:hypothetical protein